MTTEAETPTPPEPATAIPADGTEEPQTLVQAKDPLHEAMAQGKVDLFGNPISAEYAARLKEVNEEMAAPTLSPEEQEQQIALTYRGELPDDAIDSIIDARRARQADPDSQIGTSFDRVQAEKILAEQQAWLRERGVLPPEEPAAETLDDITLPPLESEEPLPVMPVDVPTGPDPETRLYEEMVAAQNAPDPLSAQMQASREYMQAWATPLQQQLTRLENMMVADWANTLQGKVQQLQRNDPDFTVYRGTLLELFRGLQTMKDRAAVAKSDELFLQFVNAARGQHIEKLRGNPNGAEGKVVGRFTGEGAKPATAEHGFSVHPDVVRHWGLNDDVLKHLAKVRGQTR